ncbi:MAG TPA: class I SAM-dependent methyltransferase [Acidimicrobiales bacterium]|nr:class I SAM-dependent methyltransferase [Acidimicrobiales bacterium]
MSDAGHDELILEHYREQAEAHRLEPSSTMADATTRDLEIRAILACLGYAVPRVGPEASLLEIGCGNGYLLSLLSERFRSLRLTGADYSPDMVDLAAGRQLPRCEVRREDVRALSFPSAGFDLLVAERCLINLLDAADQAQAISEVCRVLRPGGFAVLIEAFTDGLANLNKARVELGLAENEPPYHNLWFDKVQFLSALGGKVREVTGEGSSELPPRNFLSSHYFVSRVLYPAVTKREIIYNTEFVKFFQFLPPHGELSPIQLFFLERLPDDGDM